jgi:hypothetical protein
MMNYKSEKIRQTKLNPEYSYNNILDYEFEKFNNYYKSEKIRQTKLNPEYSRKDIMNIVKSKWYIKNNIY